MRSIAWSRKWTALTVLLIAVPTGLLGTFTLLDSLSGTAKESYPLVIIFEKDVYHPDERINITVKNVSNKTLWLSDSAYGLEYQRKTIFGWEFYVGLYGQERIVYLGPGKTGHVTRRLSTDFKPFPPGRYRVGDPHFDCWAEFQVA